MSNDRDLEELLHHVSNFYHYVKKLENRIDKLEKDTPEAHINSIVEHVSQWYKTAKTPPKKEGSEYDK